MSIAILLDTIGYEIIFAFIIERRIEMSIHNPDNLVKDPQIALNYLKEGNRRYLEDKLSNKDSYQNDRNILLKGQNPFAVILCCSDSRVAPEIFFDQKLGDIFVIRNAGNVADQTAIGSAEYAVEHLGTPLVVVCGHSHCGAVTAAYEGGEIPPNIKSITDRIQPALAMGGDVDKVIHNNVEVMVNQLQDDEIIKNNNALVVGAYYDIHTGEVKWL